jgi:hypothetical protein
MTNSNRYCSGDILSTVTHLHNQDPNTTSKTPPDHEGDHERDLVTTTSTTHKTQ